MVKKVNQAERADNESLSFDNTAIAFRERSTADLNKMYWLFRAMASKVLMRVGIPLTNFAIRSRLPVEGLIKSTIFAQFCGGESIAQCEPVIARLARGKVGTILDYSVEGVEDEQSFAGTCQEIIRTIQRAAGDKRVPLTVFKITGVGRFGLLEKVNTGTSLTLAEEAEFVKLKGRVDMICRAAVDADVPVMIDAEESWIQRTIDKLAMDMMRRYNRERALVYNTYQLYRHDKLGMLKDDLAYAAGSGFILGAKLVRGAYLEKERKRAAEMNYTSPVHATKEATDQDYDAALAWCIVNIKHVAIVAGTHNETSCLALVEQMTKGDTPADHPHVYFSQLLGMSDNLSFNLADAGYHVAKYVPYGPIKSVMPYLFRRAEENTAIAGQTGRELSLIIKERKRRRGA